MGHEEETAVKSKEGDAAESENTEDTRLVEEMNESSQTHTEEVITEGVGNEEIDVENVKLRVEEKQLEDGGWLEVTPGKAWPCSFVHLEDASRWSI